MSIDIPDYGYGTAGACWDDEYIAAPILELVHSLGASRVLDIGCGNGEFCRRLVASGVGTVVGCDYSASGTAVAQASVAGATFMQLGVDDDARVLPGGPFDVAVSLEVIEHLYDPGALMRFAKVALKPGGYLIVSTPYHGYLKNLAISLSNGWDGHWDPLWNGGHIKFWSKQTLRRVAEQDGFAWKRFIGAGRMPWMWKSLIGVFQSPIYEPSAAERHSPRPTHQS